MMIQVIAAIALITEFGYELQPRVGELGMGSPWSASGITRSTKTGGPPGFTNRRVGLSAETASCGFKVLDAPTPARYTVYIEGALYCLDPNVIAAAWVYNDLPAVFKDRVELDWEFTAWGDTHNPFRHYLGVFSDGVAGAKTTASPTPAIYHKIVLSQTATVSSVQVFDWRDSDARWIMITSQTYNVAAAPGGTLRVGIWRAGPHKYPLSRRGESKIWVGGIVVEAL